MTQSSATQVSTDAASCDAADHLERGTGSAPYGGGQDVSISEIAPYCVTSGTSIKEVISQIDQNREGLALVVDGERHLLGTVTDGDIRRAILAGMDLGGAITALLDSGFRRLHAKPITAPYGTSAIHLLRLMGERAIRHVPLVDDADRVVALALLSRFIQRHNLPLRAVIMAGGLGTRLRPLTEATPKPMLPVGDRPLLERTIEQLRQAGIRNINITTHYRADQIVAHFGDGSAFDAVVRYSHESEPLGTAGALRFMNIDGDAPLLVINGDVFTTVKYGAMHDYHREHKAHLTVGVRHYAMKVPYGVVECVGSRIRAIREKPEVGFFVNAGIYLVEPEVCHEIPENRRFDMTDLIARLIGQERRVVSFPIHEYWLDIGQLADYERAQQDVCAGKLEGRSVEE
ncbi:MAG: nucleotidyltransferase family protein [Kiloniellaceae bacterium]